MKLSTSAKTVGVILLVSAVWFAYNSLLKSPAAEEDTAQNGENFSVIAQLVEPQSWRDEIVIRGRTEAVRKVSVRTQAAGIIAETPVAAGSIVKQGDILCRIKVDARRAAVNEARAALKKADLDYKAAVKLGKEGYRSETSVAGANAALDLARANMERAALNLEQTNIRAPFDGVFDDRLAEAGDLLKIGDPCGVVIQQSPYLVTGAISERDVAKVQAGDRGRARLVTGETLEGQVRFVAKAADPRTRTFTVELEIPNEDGNLRDGVTAEFTVFAARREAYLVPRNALTLNAENQIGVRLAGDKDIVEFVKVDLLGEGAGGIWIDGFAGSVRLITRGHENVSSGQQVNVVMRDAP